MKHRPDPAGASMVALAAVGFGPGGPLARAAGESGLLVLAGAALVQLTPTRHEPAETEPLAE